MEIQFTDISHNMSILMASLESKFVPFSDFGGSNSKIKFWGNRETKGTKKTFQGNIPRKRSQVPFYYLTLKRKWI